MVTEPVRWPAKSAHGRGRGDQVPRGTKIAAARGGRVIVLEYDHRTFAGSHGVRRAAAIPSTCAPSSFHNGKHT